MSTSPALLVPTPPWGVGLLVGAALAGCTDGAALLVAPDPAADGLEGGDGPLGAEVLLAHVQARVTERLAVDVVRPAEGEGPWPTVLFVQGGLVETERYWWLAGHLATRGYTVLLPHHDLDLAITEVDDGVIALEALGRRMDDTVAAPTAALGHSLGGVVATMQWQRHDVLDAVGLLASWPAGTGPVDDRPGSEVLVVAGSTDGSAAPAEVRAGWERIRAPASLATIDGMNHYAWTDGGTPSETEGDGPLGRPLDEVRSDARHLLDRWLDHAIGGAPPPDGLGPGVVLE